MSLIHRLIGRNATDETLPFTEERLPIHGAMALFGEISRGYISFAEATSRFGLTEDEKTELQGWMTAWSASATFDMSELKDVLMLGETGLYSVAEIQARLGLTVG